MAMNRYQANQIANEINLMRTDAKMKAAQGVANLMLGSPYDDEKHLNFGTNYGVEFNFAVFSEAGEPEESGYYIKVSGVPAGVCKPLVTLLDNMDDAIAVVVNEQENNADSSVDLCTEESNNALEIDFSTEKISNSGEEPEPPEEQGDEPQDPECNAATCPGGECQEDGTCNCGTDKHWTGYQCVDCRDKPWDSVKKECKCEEGKYWSNSAGACLDNPCNDGRGCEEGYYCYSSSCSECNGYTIIESCNTYTCESIGSWPSKKINDVTYYDSRLMNWWSADRYCKALKVKGLVKYGTLVSLEELKANDGALRKALYATDSCDENSGACPSFCCGRWTSTPSSGVENSCYMGAPALSWDRVTYAPRNHSNSAVCK